MKKGQKMSEEQKIRMIESLKGRIPWNKGIKTGIKTKGTKGLKFSKEIRQKISNSLIGNTRANGNKNRLGKTHSEEIKQKIKEKLKGNIPWNKNIKLPPFSEEWKQKQSLRKGEKSANWKGGVTPENHKIRTSLKVKLWRKSCFERDNYTCQKTGIKGGKLVVHHINNFADFPELRLYISNGITLCEDVHKKFHKIYGVKNNTKEQIEEFLNS